MMRLNCAQSGSEPLKPSQAEFQQLTFFFFFLTPMAPPPISAQSHALSIPEIFELILLNLDTRTLLTKATRICHAWSHFINSSPPIQRALFFRPLDNGLNKTKTQNPLLAETFPSIFHRSGSTNGGNTNKKNDPESDTIDDKINSKLTFTTLDMVRNPQKWDAYIRPEASWRRMLVQQPPVYTLSLLRSNVGHGGQYLYIYEALVSIQVYLFTIIYTYSYLLST